MTSEGSTLFDTAIGRCGIAWSERGVTAVQLPEANHAATRARLDRRAPAGPEATPPAPVQAACDGIVALTGGAPADLSSIVLDMDRVSPFQRRVYEVARAIAPGATLTYGEIAQRLGDAGAARLVGQALGRNPFAIIVPCHRVLAAGGKLGGFSAGGGVATKLRLLTIEGAMHKEGPGLFDGERAFNYDPQAAVEHLRAADKTLARLIDAVGPFGMQIRTTPSIFAALAQAIVYQQLNGRAAATIYARVCALFPRAHDGPRAELILRASDDKLRAAGLSRSKLAALRDLSRRAVAGDLPTLAEARALGDDALIERLTEVRGIGRWTVQMLLMSRLGRPDVLPVDDYGVRMGFGITFMKGEMPARAAVEKRGERWKPYRSVASWYLWRAVDLARR